MDGQNVDLVQNQPNAFWRNLVAGGIAGTTVDVGLFPIDTIKTRMQSPQGFLKTGGFKGIYKGLGAAAGGSAPSAALFFTTYEQLKVTLTPIFGNDSATSHVIAAAAGEIMACLVRVPTENVKQKLQAGLHQTTLETSKEIIRTRGFGGFFNGYMTTVLRDVPFSMIQFPLYEAAKLQWKDWAGRAPTPIESAFCGSVTGGIAAALTTPTDVVKTRLMLQTGAELDQGVVTTVKNIYAKEGIKAFFLGVGPRVLWISLGGYFFFGAYEAAKSVLDGF